MAAVSSTQNSSWLFVEAKTGFSNDALTDLEQEIARKILAEVESEIESLDAEIRHLDNTRDRLEERRDLNIKRVMKLRTAIAPHKGLPSEILAKIFVECLDQAPVLVPPASTSAIPWSLGQVCSRWRAISQTEPALWRHLWVQSLENDSKLAFAHDILSNFCSLGGVELRLGPESHAQWANALSLVTSYRSRVQALDLQLDQSCLIPLRQPLHLFDHLHSISLTFESFRVILQQNGSVQAFSNARRLREVTINSSLDADFDDRIKAIFPWSKLTDVTLINISKPSALFILSHCSRIVNLNVSLSPGNIAPPSTGIITLPHMLSVSISARATVKKFLKPLILPSLKHMVFISQSGVPCVDRLDVINLIERSSCRVESIQTKDFLIAVESVPPLMHAMSFLTTWKVRTNGPIPDSLLSTILSEKLVPNLRVLHNWEVPSVHSAVRFMRERDSQTQSESGGGIQDSEIWIKNDNLSYADEEYFQSVLPELQTHGRRIQLIPYTSKRGKQDPYVLNVKGNLHRDI